MGYFLFSPFLFRICTTGLRFPTNLSAGRFKQDYFQKPIPTELNRDEQINASAEPRLTWSTLNQQEKGPPHLILRHVVGENWPCWSLLGPHYPKEQIQNIMLPPRPNSYSIYTKPSGTNGLGQLSTQTRANFTRLTEKLSSKTDEYFKQRKIQD